MKIVLLCLQPGAPMEVSPPREQLIDELYMKNHDIYVFLNGHIKGKEIRRKIKQLINTTGMTNQEIRKKIKEIHPSALIAFTYEDAIIAYNIIIKDMKLYYFNIEIYTVKYELSLHEEGYLGCVETLFKYVISKIKEVIFVQRTELFVVQDKLRKEISEKYFVTHKNTILIPNSFPFIKENVCDKRVNGICYAGSFCSEWTAPLDTGFENVKTPITFSGWGQSSFLCKIKKMNNVKIIYQRLSSMELNAFLKQYAVGLISYSDSEDDNVKYIGLASGKFFKHLSLGQPVIAIYSPGMAEEIEKYHLGVVIRNASEIDTAYEQIMNNYEYYKKNVVSTYRRKYDYKKTIQKFLKFLK